MRISSFDLSIIASQLEGLEETIIYRLIDRAQFAQNAEVYRKGESGFPESELSLFDLRLYYQEYMDARFGRFMVPEERPYHGNLPNPERSIDPEAFGFPFTDFNKINLTEDIRKAYLKLVPELCCPGDDGHHGSSVEHDVYPFQAISRRIHFGAFYVAESKYKNNAEEYTKLITENNREGIIQLLTRKEVEQKILERVSQKVAYAQKYINTQVRGRISEKAVLSFYRESIIPLTKEGEIQYLFNRV